MKDNIQIVATIGPATNTKEKIMELARAGMDIARLNFSWGSYEEHERYIALVREVGNELGKKILVLQDLSGPRIQEEVGHSFNASTLQIITEKDKADIVFGVAQGVDYIAQSFVARAEDIIELKELIAKEGALTPVIAKIERQEAIDNLEAIIAVSDGIMIARGDLGDNVPLETLPLVSKDILEACNKAKKPVIVATQMLYSMVKSPVPTRAEVSDVAFAVLSGADAVMLSDETAAGAYPTEAVDIMRRTAGAASARLALSNQLSLNQFTARI